MIQQISQIAVLMFGLLVTLVSAWGMVAPSRVIAMARALIDRTWGIYIAALARLLLGAALILSAPISQFPVVFHWLGWIALAAAVGILLVGTPRLRRMTDWFERLPPVVIRSWMVLGVAFGAFLIVGASFHN